MQVLLLVVFLIVSMDCFAKSGLKSPKERQDHDLSPSYWLGYALSFPDLSSLELNIPIHPGHSFRVFVSPPLPINIELEIEARDYSAHSGYKVGSPEILTTIHASYGPSFGVGYYASFYKNFFLGLTLSRRQLEAKASAESPILICSSATAVTCHEQEDKITTRTTLGLDAKIISHSTLLRPSIGWLGNISRRWLFLFELGWVIPIWSSNLADADIGINSSEEDSPAIQGALELLREEKEQELEKDALAALEPYTIMQMPLLKFGIAFRF